MMPPTNRLGGALQIASQVASIYSGFGGTNLFQNFGGFKFGKTAIGAGGGAVGGIGTLGPNYGFPVG